MKHRIFLAVAAAAVLISSCGQGARERGCYYDQETGTYGLETFRSWRNVPDSMFEVSMRNCLSDVIEDEPVEF